MRRESQKADAANQASSTDRLSHNTRACGQMSDPEKTQFLKEVKALRSPPAWASWTR